MNPTRLFCPEQKAGYSIHTNSSVFARQWIPQLPMIFKKRNSKWSKIVLSLSKIRATVQCLMI